MGLASCTEQNVVETIEPGQSLEKAQAIRLGKPLENPYALANMQAAWESVMDTYPALANVAPDGKNLSPTHYYIRLAPKTERELDILESDTTLTLYEYPLDYEIEEGGIFYHDPSLPAEQPTYQYCAVAVDQVLPEGIAFDILEELFIPESLNGPLEIAPLLTAAFQQTGHPYTPQVQSKWQPSGRIWVRERLSNNTTSPPSTTYLVVPLAGVKVRARNWFTTVTGYTNATGNFTADGTLSGDATYSVVWESNDWDIRMGALSQAVLTGPTTTGAWNYTIDNDKLSRWHAMVHQAAYEYYYDNSVGLDAPPKKSFWNSKLKISTFDEADGTNGSHCAPCRLGGGLIPIIYLYNPNRTSDALFGTAVHELAHASHWEFRRWDWDGDKIERRLKESWAEGVEWLFVMEKYPPYISGYEYQGSYQLRYMPEHPIYTAMMVDFHDNYNQLLENQPFQVYADDQVYGYSFLQMERVLLHSNSFEEFGHEMMELYQNSTEMYIQRLINYWSGL